MNNKIYKHIVALTGSIGSGKTTASKMFKELGAKVISADKLAHSCLKPNSPAYPIIIKYFGRKIINKNKSINRSRLAGFIFSDPQKKKILESIIHPLVKKNALRDFKSALKKKYPLIIYDCPLLFETGLNKLGFKKIICITVNKQIQLKRILNRSNISKYEAYKRIKSQLPQKLKALKSDYIIRNNSDLEMLKRNVRKICLKLLKD